MLSCGKREGCGMLGSGRQHWRPVGLLRGIHQERAPKILLQNASRTCAFRHLAFRFLPGRVRKSLRQSHQ
jgi:hypothetical protein